ncbi:MAG: dihydropteroate synthase [Actinomycetota bacterium]|nr:dihydropteroate synthase [Actinomycetota bacterium]
MKLLCRGRVLSLDRTAVMGVLNVTPDSFSDGGLWLEAGAAVDHGQRMAAEGAAIIDVGGESTRPGAEPVAEKDELERVLPVISGLVDRIEVPISIDTRKPQVARRAVEAGASIVNDTAGEWGGRGMDQVAAETGAGIAVMHSRGTPATMVSLTDYFDVVKEVSDFLIGRAEELQRLGVHPESIVLDPGFGFAKTPEQNLELLRHLHEVVGLGFPVLSGTSRKSFIGAVLGGETEDRLEGTLATVAWSVVKGARIVRVHDVTPVSRMVKMIEAITSGEVTA